MVISTIELITDIEEIQKLYEFIKKAPLNYPNYEAWTQQCYNELRLGIKKSLVCKLNGIIVGNIIFQTHKTEPRILELKNGRIEPQYMGRGIMSSLLKQVERFAIEDGKYMRLMTDTHADNLGVRSLLERADFKLCSEERLYNQKSELVFVKDLT